MRQLRPQEPAPTDQRYSIKLNAPQGVGGRLTATRIEAYFTEETDGYTRRWRERRRFVDRRARSLTIQPLSACLPP
jgi:hypothetical protein